MTGINHYDLPARLFELFLDHHYHAYSAGRWAHAEGLEMAQRHNQTAIVRALGLTRDSSVLDIGCGWGAFARECSRIGPRLYVGLTPSREQIDYVHRFAHKRLANFELHRTPWQQFAPTQKFDAVVALEVIEHIASSRDVAAYRRFFEFAARSSTPTAKLYVQTTLQRRPPRTRAERSALWFVLRRVFPGSITADLACLQAASEGIYSPSNIDLDAMDYILTLDAWRTRLHRARDELSAERFQFFDRYFESCLYLFETGVIDLLRTTLVKVTTAACQPAVTLTGDAVIPGGITSRPGSPYLEDGGTTRDGSVGA